MWFFYLLCINGFHIGQDQLQVQLHLFQSIAHHKENSALSLSPQVAKIFLWSLGNSGSHQTCGYPKESGIGTFFIFKMQISLLSMRNLWFYKNLKILQERKIDCVNIFFLCKMDLFSPNYWGCAKLQVTGVKKSITESISWLWQLCCSLPCLTVICWPIGLNTRSTMN